MKRLLSQTEVPDGCLSADQCRNLFERVKRLSRGGGHISLGIQSRWTGYVRWARNEIVVSGDTISHEIGIKRTLHLSTGAATTNRIDDESLAVCVQRAEATARVRNVPGEGWWEPRRAERYAAPKVWSDHTVQVNSQARVELQRTLSEPAVSAKLLSAGYIRVEAIGHGIANSEGLFAYEPATRAEFSMTVRDFKRNGAGWAGVDQVDWRQINPERIASIALDKCQRSVDPVAIEPGRYTAVLEPQAVADLVYPLIESLERIPPEIYMTGPWAYRENQTKIGQMVMDERISITADPEDLQVPFVPFTFYGDPYRAVQWFSEGVLEHLAYPRPYALKEMNRTDPLVNSKAFRMDGGSSTVSEMIKQTQRGIFVTRFVNVRMIDFKSLLCSGTTSDGTWLIENGKITKAIKNFRIRESPLFVLNNVEAIGEPVRVLMNQPAMVPPVRVRDFCMIALSDGV